VNPCAILMRVSKLGCWALIVFAFELNSVRRQVGYLTKLQFCLKRCDFGPPLEHLLSNINITCFSSEQCVPIGTLQHFKQERYMKLPHVLECKQIKTGSEE